MVIAYHLIWTAYGTWLPNDPRGSGSTTVRSASLAELGELHFGRRKIQPTRSKVRAFYAKAESLLRFPVLRYDAGQREIIATGIAHAIEQNSYTCYACAVMPDHVHLIIRKHRRLAEDMIEHLQETTREHLHKTGAPADHPIWTEGGWRAFLDSPEYVRSVVRYIENNPINEGLPRQEWPFVRAHDNWPFHKQR